MIQPIWSTPEATQAALALGNWARIIMPEQGIIAEQNAAWKPKMNLLYGLCKQVISDGRPFPLLSLSMQMVATDFPGVVRLGSHQVMKEEWNLLQNKYGL